MKKPIAVYFAGAVLTGASIAWLQGQVVKAPRLHTNSAGRVFVLKTPQHPPLASPAALEADHVFLSPEDERVLELKKIERAVEERNAALQGDRTATTPSAARAPIERAVPSLTDKPSALPVAAITLPVPAAVDRTNEAGHDAQWPMEIEVVRDQVERKWIQTDLNTNRVRQAARSLTIATPHHPGDVQAQSHIINSIDQLIADGVICKARGHKWMPYFGVNYGGGVVGIPAVNYPEGYQLRQCAVCDITQSRAYGEWK